MDKIIQNKLGNIIISKEVIATISGVAAMECYGLVGMASRKMKDGISELLGRDNLTKGVEVSIEKDFTKIDLYIIVEYGTKISEVANNVIEKVKYTLENKLDLKKVKINVIVQSVRVSNFFK